MTITSPLMAFDTHVDIPWQERDSHGFPAIHGTVRDDFWLEKTTRRFTVPKAHQGRVGAVCLAAYVPQASLSEEGMEAAWRRTQAMLEVIHQSTDEEKSPSARLCRTVQDIREAVAQGVLAIVPVVENGYGLGDHPERIGELVSRFGIRYLTLTHNGHNQLADAAVARGEPPRRHGGLSIHGRRVIAEMNRHGVLVDVSHASKETMLQACDLSQTPVVASHSCVRHLCDHPRNLDDEQLIRLRDTGGVIQITAMGAFLREGGNATIADMVKHICYAVDLIGLEHVGFSSDFDGGGGIEGWKDASQTDHVVHALRDAGFHDDACRALCGGNMMRLLDYAEKEACKDMSREN